jgi:hypothetical protein
MYGLPQPGILANKLLTKCLAVHGYAPTTHMPGLWRHATHPVMFIHPRIGQLWRQIPAQTPCRSPLQRPVQKL